MVEVETPTASPFASSLLFDYVATYMYEGDTPNAERRAAALALDRELLRELLGQEELRELIDPGALERSRPTCSGCPSARARTRVDALHDVLRRVGDLTLDELRPRAAPGADLDGLARRSSSGERRAIVAARRRRAALGRRPRTPACTATRSAPCRPAACPRRSSPTCRTRWSGSSRRWARTHGPFEAARCASATGSTSRRCWPGSSAPASSCAASCARAARSASGATPRCCGGCAAPRSPRCARRSSRPTSARSRASCRAGRASTATRRPARGSTACARCSSRSRGSRCRVEVWERDVLPRRTGAYSPGVAGPAVRGGRGRLGRRRARSAAARGRVALYFRDDAAVLGPPPGARGDSAERSPSARTTRSATRLRQGACFFTDLLVDVAGIPAEELQEALWDLVWAGEATNDAFAPLRSPRAVPRRLVASRRAAERAARRRRFGARRAGAQPQVQGRWSLTAPLFARAPTIRPRAAARRPSCCSSATASSPASRCSPRASRAASPRSTTRSRALETIGVCQRGYFIEGLGGAQFALPGAVERLRAQRDDDAAPPVVLAATDPAQPYGAVLKWPRRATGRSPGAPGRRLRRARRRRAGALRRARRQGPAGPRRRRTTSGSGPRVEALADAVERGRIRRLALERVNGEPVVGSAWEEPPARARLPRRPAQADASARRPSAEAHPAALHRPRVTGRSAAAASRPYSQRTHARGRHDPLRREPDPARARGPRPGRARARRTRASGATAGPSGSRAAP